MEHFDSSSPSNQRTIHEFGKTNGRPPFRAIDPQLLRSSYALSDREISEMKSLLEAEEGDVKWYKEEIDRVETLLDSLKAEKKALEVNIEQRRSIVASLWKLPTEVWELVFDMVCQTSHHGGASLVIDYADFEGKAQATEQQFSMIPITLSHVCSRWRHVALGCPRLWSTIFFAFENLPKHAHDLLLTFLKNSKGYPLDLYVETGDLIANPDTVCRDAIVRHLSRCTQLSISGQTYNILLAMDPAPAVSFPNLTHFYSDTNDDAIDPENWFWKALGILAPKLDDATIPLVLPSTSLPYRQLTELTITWLFSNDFRDLLEVLRGSLGQLRSLRVCSIVHDPKLPMTALNPVDIELPLLTTLILDNFSDNIDTPLELNDPLLGCLFASLTMPSIHTFVLCCTDIEHATRTTQPVNWPPSLLTMLSRSSSSLRQMTLFIQSFQGFLAEPLSSLLRHTPHLTSFDFRLTGKMGQGNLRSPTHRYPQWNKYLPTFLSDLTSLHSPVLPKLTNLSIRIADVRAREVVESFVKLANSRSPTVDDGSVTGPVVSPLATLQLKRYRSLWWRAVRDAFVPHPPKLVHSPELEEAIEDARQRGVNVVVGDVARHLDDIDSDEEGDVE
ncbi:hypothetical protein AAF712_010447 [Marasmius tenuissimus]|uniref:F-box domain-containing protein n=1 Tax=Marasmius tenuissimus TaxID=585030 RepID=A0ABR2ZMW1_9AGAR